MNRPPKNHGTAKAAFRLLFRRTGFAAFLLAAVAGCRPDSVQGELTTAHIPIATYVNAQSATENATTFSFPVLEIYDSTGRLLYRSRIATENERVLRDLPSAIRNLSPRPGPESLTAILEAVPEFKAREQELLRRHHPVVVSTVLDNCGACSIQEDAVRGMRQRILQQSIDLLVMEVDPQ